jgi:hypothetical protein
VVFGPLGREFNKIGIIGAIGVIGNYLKRNPIIHINPITPIIAEKQTR